MPKRFYDGDDGNDGFGCAGCLVAIPDYFDTGEGTNTVVNAYHTLGIVRHLGESVLHGVEASLTTIGQSVLHVEMIFLAELMPIVLLGFWQYQDNLQISIVLPESLQRPHQHRLATNGQELLGNVASHPQSLSSCHNYYVVHYFFFFLHRTLRTNTDLFLPLDSPCQYVFVRCLFSNYAFIISSFSEV